MRRKMKIPWPERRTNEDFYGQYTHNEESDTVRKKKVISVFGGTMQRSGLETQIPQKINRTDGGSCIQASR